MFLVCKFQRKIRIHLYTFWSINFKNK